LVAVGQPRFDVERVALELDGMRGVGPWGKSADNLLCRLSAIFPLSQNL
jgi:hypothetical protein